MVGWDISRIRATFSPQEAKELRSIGTPLAQFCVDIQASVQVFATQTSHLPGFDLPDPIAIAVALDSTICLTSKQLFVAIETQSQLGRGQTIVDHMATTGNPPNVNVVLDVSRERFVEMLSQAVG